MTKEQQKAYDKARYEANSEAVKARVRAYAAAHREEISAYKKSYGEANKEKLKAKSKAYYAANRAERIACQKALHESKPEMVKAYKKQWWSKNKEAFAAHRAKSEMRAATRAQSKKWYDRTYQKHRLAFCARNAKRRALKKATQVEPIDFAQVLMDSKGLCGICQKPFDLFGIDFDHVIPLSKGGTHTRKNLQATHAYCNRSKGARVG